MSELLCKWVDQDMTTMNDTLWKVGVPNELPEKDDLQLCAKGLFYYVTHPLLAVMFKSFHNCIHYTRLYEVNPEGKIVKNWDKCGSTKLTLVKELEVPTVTVKQRTAFALLSVLEVYSDEVFVEWANKWLNNKDRSTKTAIKVVCNIANNTCNYTSAGIFDISVAAFDIVDAVSVSTFHVSNAGFNAVACAKYRKPDLDLISIVKKAMEVH